MGYRILLDILMEVSTFREFLNLTYSLTLNK